MKSTTSVLLFITLFLFILLMLSALPGAQCRMKHGWGWSGERVQGVVVCTNYSQGLIRILK